MTIVPVATKVPLVITSQIGQLKHAENLLKKIGISVADLAILYTEKNINMPKLIMGAADRTIFRNVHLTQIHAESTRVRKEVILSNQKVYSNLLDQTTPSSLFVCSYEHHYALLCGEARKRGVELNLFEEGAGSFKGIVPGYVSLPTPPLTTSLKQMHGRLSKNNEFIRYVVNPIFAGLRGLYHAFLGLLAIPKLVSQLAAEIRTLPQMKSPQDIPSEFMNGWKRFDNVYSSNPQIMSQIFEAGSFIEVPLRFDDQATIEATQELISRYQIDGRTVIFTSQRYHVEQRDLMRSILDSLSELAAVTGYRILIKLHPKEDIKVAKAYDVEIAKRSNSNIEVMTGASVPAEYLALYSDAPAVVGLASSTLLYAPKVKPGLRSISIGRLVLKKLKDRRIDSAGTRMLYENLKIFDYIPYVETFSGEAGTRK